ncbi:MAG: hypothetical protein LBS86_07045 [Treponema sp.]|nr:hypothetical protein [Treponema sp.]
MKEKSAPLPESAPASEVPPAWKRPLVIIKSGENPLWFELIGANKADNTADNPVAEGGLRLIATPGEAALTDFTPWPLARNISGMLIHNDTLVLAVNRDGFLAALPTQRTGDEAPSIALYRIADNPWWNRYSVDSLFMFEDKPTALFYRDDFFIDSPEHAPDPRTQSLARGETRPIAVEMPAFTNYSASDGWDIDSLRQGPDGAWYCRAIHKTQTKIVYLHANDLSQSAETVPLGAFMNSANPEPVEQAPPLLRATLNAAFELSGAEKLNIAAIISGDFSYTRHFSAHAPDSGDNLVELSGYSTENRALVILPDGRGVYGDAPDVSDTMQDASDTAPNASGTTQGASGTAPNASGTAPNASDTAPNASDTTSDAADTTSDASGTAQFRLGGGPDIFDTVRITWFRLPALPRGFVYTGIGPAGDAIIASWEEQEDLGVGAAGLMIVDSPTRPAPRD